MASIIQTVMFAEWLSSLPIGPVALIAVLVFLGELLLGLEFFVIPGFGAGGILGAIALLAATVVAWGTYGAVWGVAVLLGSAVCSFAGLLYGMKTKIIQKRFVLDVVQKKGQGTIAQDLSSLVGRCGTALTDLRPAGAAHIDEQRIDVISEGGFIVHGTPIEVVLVEGPRVVVKEVEN